MLDAMETKKYHQDVNISVVHILYDTYLGSQCNDIGILSNRTPCHSRSPIFNLCDSSHIGDRGCVMRIMPISFGYRCSSIRSGSNTSTSSKM